MWKRGGGRSSALDRAQALLSAKRSRGGAAATGRRSAGHTVAVGESDLSDLASVSSSPDGSAENLQRGDDPPTQDLRAPSSLCGGGRRFLKKPPPPAANSSQTPEHRYLSSSQRGKTVLDQVKQGPRPAENLSSDVRISAAARSLEAPEQISASSSSDLPGNRFLKKKAAVSSSDTAAARCPVGPHGDARSRSRAHDAGGPSSVRVVNGVSLESDEEDMKILLGDSLDSPANRFSIPGIPSSIPGIPSSIPGIPSSIRAADKMLSRSRQEVHSSPSLPPPAAVPPSSSSPASPSHHSSSPFRFTGQNQAHFSPSVLSPSPSGPGRLTSPHRVGSPRLSLSSMSGYEEVRSLAELFSVGPGSEDLHSERSSVTSEDFEINLMTLDDLVAAEETPGEEAEMLEDNHRAPLHGSSSRHQEEEEEEEEDVVDYHSDFESESRTDRHHSVSQVSEQLQGGEDEEEVVSEVREEASHSNRRTEDDYSSTFSDTSQTADHSQTLSRSRSSRFSRSSVSHRTSSHLLKKPSSTRTALKEAAVQTQPDLLAHTWPTGLTDLTYADPTPAVAHTLSAEMVEALSSYNPAVFALNEMLKQQLAMARRFIESHRHLHSSLVQSLETPNYRYTTLEDTKEYIRKHRRPTLTMDEALEEVMQEMRDDHHI